MTCLPRRNYSNMFSEILASGSLMSNPAFQLHLIGRGTVEVPASLSGVVTTEESLPYEVSTHYPSLLCYV